jgi:ribosomal-protein-alanine N-acetyltransferase
MSAEFPIPDLSTETPRLLVRALRPADRDEVIRVHTISEAHFAPWWPVRDDGRTLAEHIDFLIDRARARAADGTGARYVGLLKVAGQTGEPTRLVAMLNLNNIVRGVFQNADAGWSVSVDCAGRGLGTEGVAAMLDLAFAPPPRGLGLHRVQANIIPNNTASLRLAEKCGFRREGLAREMLKIAGRWQDHAMFAKLASEHRPIATG